MSDNRTAPPRAVLVGVQLAGVDDAEFTASLDELARLAKTLGVAVVGRVGQKRSALAPGAVLGEGKLKELAALTGGEGVVPRGPAQRRKGGRKVEEASEASGDEPEVAEVEEDAPAGATDEPDADPAAGGDASAGGKATVVIVDHDLTPTQLRNLERATGAEVLDRTAVILAIFQRHAHTREARLQVEIARLAYMAPRLREAGGRDRQGGGIGAKGAGESAAQLERRKVRDRIAELRAELASIEREAGTRRQRRAGHDTVALVGYTNAGKSSLMRGLTGNEVYVADKLFATLDTTVRALQPETRPRILVSDTVGFLKKLPHDLVASFRSTLEEAADADLKLHVVDAANPAFAAQIAVTREVLAEIGAADAPELLLLNKIDRVDAARRAELAAAFPDAMLLSARSREDIARLRERIIRFFERDMVEAILHVPYAQQRIVAEIHRTCRVLEETFGPDGTEISVRTRPAVLARLRTAL
jgi:GTP-binding protein HflX